MKCIIAGSRSIDSLTIVEKAIEESEFDISLVISGTAKGIDKLGEFWADKHNIPILRMPADWQKHGKAAGPIRNQEMSKVCDCAIIIWDSESKGTKHMIECMVKANKPYYLYLV